MRYHTYEVLKAELNNDRIKWAYLPYSMHMAGRYMKAGCTHVCSVVLLWERVAVRS